VYIFAQDRWILKLEAGFFAKERPALETPIPSEAGGRIGLGELPPSVTTPRSTRDQELFSQAPEEFPPMTGSLRGKAALAFLGTLLLLPARPIQSADETAHWAAWRGPQGTGVAPGADPPVSWSEKENVRWAVEIPGSGTASPVLHGERLFILTAVPVPGAAARDGAAKEAEKEAPGKEGQSDGERKGRRGRGGRGAPPDTPQRFEVLCLERGTGNVRWRKVAREEKPHEGHHQDHGFASASPVTDGEHLIASFGSRGVFCYTLDGDLVWEKDLGDMKVKNSFGEGASPALRGKTVVVNWDHEGGSFIVALDKTTGKELWKKDRAEGSTWTTPVIVDGNGKTQVVVSATNRSRSYDLANGELLWELKGQTDNVIPTPVAGNGLIYLTSGFRGAALQAVRLDKTAGDVTGSEAVVWQHGSATPYVPSPLLYGERIYFLSGNNGILSCHDARTGKALYEKTRLPGVSGVYASLVGAAGRVYIIGRDGGAVVLRDGPAFEVLAENKLDDRFDASPAVAGKQLFLRGHRRLYCLEKKA
jgi:outer membrane protein assembly factor BamB